MAPRWNCIECDSKERGFIRPGGAEQVGPPAAPSPPIIRGPLGPAQRETPREPALHCTPGAEFPFYSQKQSYATAEGTPLQEIQS